MLKSFTGVTSEDELSALMRVLKRFYAKKLNSELEQLWDRFINNDYILRCSCFSGRVSFSAQLSNRDWTMWLMVLNRDIPVKPCSTARLLGIEQKARLSAGLPDYSDWFTELYSVA